MMDRQAITGRVVSRDIAVSGAAVILPQGVAQKLVKNILEAAGFFDLLETAEEIYNEFGYVLPLPQKNRLRDAIRKAKGGTP